ncbi:hypothetical protein R5W23_000889 [Gemmata sp. JC673]|uniref:Carboxypeptidase regulatory-like domain-containing protein n=1 Tax=Gemmata algarum TaxID=2975278 RepID=A0ABU5EWQ2_9BACT|nr:hypothetical protein [Gemmata algarum]MDY3559731.1 hypothetical protein [Gemmata algarum]
MTTYLFRALTFCAGIALLGCGKPPEERSATVTGKVTLAGGKPLTGGTIHFRSTVAVHRVGSGDVAADGTYTVKSVPMGPCKVFVENGFLRPVDKSSGYTMPEGVKQPPPGAKWVPIPQKYTAENSTDLTTDVNADPFTYNVELK